MFPGGSTGCKIPSQLPRFMAMTEMQFPVLKGHLFLVRLEMRCLRRVVLIELLPERPDAIDLADSGCMVCNCMHRVNIRVKTINYDG
jgi:hypothetical protein